HGLRDLLNDFLGDLLRLLLCLLRGSGHCLNGGGGCLLGLSCCHLVFLLFSIAPKKREDKTTLTFLLLISSRTTREGPGDNHQRPVIHPSEASSIMRHNIPHRATARLL